MSKHLAIIIAYGPEIRSFVYSGLADQLREHLSVSLVAFHPSSQAFRQVDLPVLALPEAAEPAPLQRLRELARASKHRWLQRTGFQRWSHSCPASEQRQAPGSFKALAHRAASFRLTAALSGRCERLVARAASNHAAWRRLFCEHGFDGVLAAGTNAGRLLPALQTARNLGLKVAVVCNSWKDAYVNPHLPMAFDRLMVWSEEVARHLAAANPSTRATMAAIGSLHLQPFLSPQHDDIMPKVELCERYGMDPIRPYLCYTAGAPAIEGGEVEIVELLMAAIQRNELPDRPQVLLRINPMEDGERFARLVERYADLYLQRPEWEWQAERDWCCPLQGDTRAWLATVAHAALNLSIGSTVTVEFAALRRPVINIAFDLPEQRTAERSNRRFWDSAFYAHVRETGYPHAAFSAEEMLGLIRGFLNGELSVSEPQGLFASDHPVTDAAEQIREMMA